MRLTDLLLVFPTLFLMIAVVAAFGSSLTILVAVLGLMSWQVGARVVRGEVLAVKNREFVLAARTLGARSARLLVRHVLAERGLGGHRVGHDPCAADNPAGGRTRIWDSASNRRRRAGATWWPMAKVF